MGRELRRGMCAPRHLNSRLSPTTRLRVDRCVLADIEEITQKTGNSKKFSVFLKMLQAAIQQQGESVFIDILTYADLQALKSRKAASAGGLPAGGVTSSRNQKRYLILTHASQFDRCAVRFFTREASLLRPVRLITRDTATRRAGSIIRCRCPQSTRNTQRAASCKLATHTVPRTRTAGSNRRIGSSTSFCARR